MELVLIFLCKDSSKVVEGKQVLELLNKVCDKSTSTKLTYAYNENEFTLDYSISKNNSKEKVLIVKCKETPFKAAQILDSFQNALRKGSHRKEFYIVVSYNEASKLFCEKAMRYLGNFERRIRELIYLILIHTFGVDWKDKTISEKIQNELKDRHAQQLVENALQEMDIAQLENYLFEPTFPSNFSEWFDEFADKGNLETMTKEALISTILSMRKRTVWESYFNQIYSINEIKTTISIIRSLRNKVMHHKDISFEEFQDLKSITNNVTKKLIDAIEKIQEQEFTEEDFISNWTAFSSVISAQMEVYKQLSKNLADIYNPIAEQVQKLSESFSQIYQRIIPIGKIKFEFPESLKTSFASLTIPIIPTDSSKPQDPDDVLEPDEESNHHLKGQDDELSNEIDNPSSPNDQT